MSSTETTIPPPTTTTTSSLTCPPGPVCTSITTICQEWTIIQQEKSTWEIEKKQLQTQLQAQQLTIQTLRHEKNELQQQIQVLEYGLKQEREKLAKYTNNQEHTPIKSSSENDSVESNGTAIKQKPKKSVAFSSDGPVEFSPPPSTTDSSNSSNSSFSYSYSADGENSNETANEASGPLNFNYADENDEQQSNTAAQNVINIDEGDDEQTSADKNATMINVNKQKELSQSNFSPDPASSIISVSSPPISSKSPPSSTVVSPLNKLTLKPLKPRHALRSHLDSVRCCSFDSDENSQLLLTGSEDGTAKLWKVAETGKIPQEPIHTFRAHTGMVTSVAIRSSLGCFTASTDGTINRYSIPPIDLDPYESHGIVNVFHRGTMGVPKKNEAIWSLALHPNEALVYSAVANQTVQIWNPNASYDNAAHTVECPQIPVSVVAMEMDHDKMGVGWLDGSIGLIDVSTGSILHHLTTPSNARLTSIFSHPTLPLLLTSHIDQSVRLWDLNSSSCIHTLSAHRSQVTSLTCSYIDGGKTLYSSGHDESVRCWDLATYKIQQVLESYQTHRSKYNESIHSITAHRQWKMLASGGADATVKIYAP